MRYREPAAVGCRNNIKSPGFTGVAMRVNILFTELNAPEIPVGLTSGGEKCPVEL
jgi:hypothetical protein